MRVHLGLQSEDNGVRIGEQRMESDTLELIPTHHKYSTKKSEPKDSVGRAG